MLDSEAESRQKLGVRQWTSHVSHVCVLCRISRFHMKYSSNRLNMSSRGVIYVCIISIKVAVVCIVGRWSLVEEYRRFRGACCLHHRRDERDQMFLSACNNSKTDLRFFHKF
jgi:hypothetical protein